MENNQTQESLGSLESLKSQNKSELTSGSLNSQTSKTFQTS
jgi:hypothetical protein